MRSLRFLGSAALCVLALSSPVLAAPPAAETPEKPSHSEAPSSIVPKAPPYKTERWEEDYTYLRDPAARTDWLDSLKYIPLNDKGDWYLTLAGQARYRYEFFNNNTFGVGPQDPNGYHLIRVTESADLHLSPYFRVYAEARSAFETGRVGGPRGTDEDQLDPQQLFADINVPLDPDTRFTFRGGRQEIPFGAERLIGISDFSNVRKHFDGYRAMLVTKSNDLEAFLTRPVLIDRYDFDETNNSVIFAGVYDTLKLPDLIKGAGSKLEAYWLYLEQDNTSYPTDGTGREERYTVGTRFTTNPKPFDLDLELDYQWGRFNGENISAYSLALDTGYTAAHLPLTPRAFLGFDIASGDRHPGGSQETFNQLFPSGHTYFGYIDAVGRQNIIDLHPGVDLTLVSGARYAEKVTLRAEYHQFWRQSDNDALYNTAGAVVRAGTASGSRSIGGELDLLLRWQISRHLGAYVGYSHFWAGSFIADTGPSDDIDFAYAALTFTF
jgi:hypothetical protein